MRVDQFDFARREPRFAERRAHGPRRTRAAGQGRSHVVRVGAESEARYFTVDVRVAGDGVGVALEHEDGRTFGHHESIAVAIEGAAGALGFVVARRHRPDDCEGSEDER